VTTGQPGRNKERAYWNVGICKPDTTLEKMWESLDADDRGLIFVFLEEKKGEEIEVQP